MTNEVLAKRIADLERQLSDERMKSMRLENERDALVAQVEMLRNAWGSVKATDWNKPLDEAFSATPQQCLAEIKAEAGRAGFVAGYHKCWRESYGTKPNTDSVDEYADSYANRVGDGQC